MREDQASSSISVSALVIGTLAWTRTPPAVTYSSVEDRENVSTSPAPLNFQDSVARMSVDVAFLGQVREADAGVE